MQLPECLMQDGARQGYVQSHEPLSFLAEHFTIIQCQVGFLHEEVYQCLVV